MTVQQFTNLLGIVLGLVSGLFFCVGSARLKASKIRVLAGTHWGSNPEVQQFFVTLKSDYLCGGFVLTLSFVLLFIASLPGVSTTQLFTHGVCGDFAAVLAGVGTGCLLWLYRNRSISRLYAELTSGAADGP